MLLSSRKYRTYKYFPSFHLFFLQLHDSRKFKIFSNYLKKKTLFTNSSRANDRGKSPSDSEIHGAVSQRRISERSQKGSRSRRKSLAHESGSRFGDNSRRRSCVSVDPSPPTPERERKLVHR